MEISHRESGDVVIVDLSGVLFEWAHQQRGREEFLNMISGLVEQGKNRVVFNLEKVEGVDSLGWAILLHAYKRIREVGGEVVLINAGDKYKPLLKVLRLDKLWKHFDSEEEAIEHLSS